jgi:hypothetical protein
MEGCAETILSSFERLNLVALGERHWAREDAQFRLKLLLNPALAGIVNDVVIEFGNSLYQTVLDRFVDGNDVQLGELRRVWQDTTQPGTWDSPIYEEFIVAIRSLNGGLPSGRRLRVLGADYPIDWGSPSPDPLSAANARDAFAAALIQREVLNKNRKALLLFGSAHLYRSRPGTVINLLGDESKAESYIVVPIGGPDLPSSITALEATADAPVLLPMNSTLGDVAAVDVLERGTKRLQVVNGKPVFIDGKPVFIPVPVFEASVKLKVLADACLYFGNAHPVFVEPPAALYEGTQYGTEVQSRRRRLFGG